MAELERTRSLRAKQRAPLHFDVTVLQSVAERLGACLPWRRAAPAAAKNTSGTARAVCRPRLRPSTAASCHRYD